MKEGIGYIFQNETKYFRKSFLAFDSRKVGEKIVKEKIEQNPISLPEPERENGQPLWKVINERRSIRQFKRKPVSLSALSQILWAAQGISCKKDNFYLRTTPSAGALYPVVTYISVQAVEGLSPGIYQFLPEAQALKLRAQGDFGRELAAAALDQDFLAEASLVLLWTGVWPRVKWRYGERGFRYLYLDAGHIAQNAALAAVSLGLATCPVAAFFDDEINDLLGVNPEEETILYIEAVGWKK